jgi:hypothetical protein
MWGISWLAEDLLVSKEGLGVSKKVSKLNPYFKESKLCSKKTSQSVMVEKVTFVCFKYRTQYVENVAVDGT